MGEDTCNTLSVKEIMYRMHKDFLLINMKMTDNSKTGKTLDYYFTKEDIQLIFKHMKRSQTSLVIMEMQVEGIIHTSMHLPEQQNKTKEKTIIIKHWQRCVATRTLSHSQQEGV